MSAYHSHVINTASHGNMGRRCISGFTLVELAIVLVVIGVLVGGVLVGQSLIQQAQIRSTFAQLRSYNVGAMTFRQKFAALPGDAKPRTALSAGLVTRTGTAGRGDGNGVLENGTVAPQGLGYETALFWSDLSVSGFTDKAFTLASDAPVASQTVATISNYLPTTKDKGSSYYHVYALNGRNYFYLGGVAAAATDTDGVLSLANSLTPIEAFAIDEKLDDGIPASGGLRAVSNITANTPATGTGLSGECLNAAAYNTAGPFADIPGCRISMRAEF